MKHSTALILVLAIPTYSKCVIEKNRLLVGHSQDVAQVENMNQCIVECKKRSYCKSGTFFSVGATCVLNNASRTTNPESYQVENTDPRTYYFENCEPFGDDHNTNRVRSLCNAENNMILLGSVDVLVLVLDMDDCVRRCERRHSCKSAMYMAESKQCIMNTDTRRSHAEMFVPSEQETIYFEKCGADARKQSPEQNDAQTAQTQCTCKAPDNRTTKTQVNFINRNRLRTTTLADQTRTFPPRFATSATRRKPEPSRVTTKSFSSTTTRQAFSRTTPQTNPQCQDKDRRSDCRKVKLFGFCDRRVFIETLCRRTCGYC